MIPVYVHDVVTHEDRETETYLVLLKSDLNLEGTMPVNIGPFSAMNLASKIEEGVEGRYDSQNLVSEILDDSDVKISKIRLFRDERGRYRAKIIERSDGESLETYKVELTDALAIAAETECQLEIPPQLLQNTEIESQQAEEKGELLEKISNLRYELEDALEDEEYEKAERLKKELNSEVRKLEQTTDTEENINQKLREAYRSDAE